MMRGMESREIVLRAIERRDPPRIPINYCNRAFDGCERVGIRVGSAGWDDGPAALVPAG
jgi:hypothetical protein